MTWYNWAERNIVPRRGSSTALDLDENYDTVQESGADLVLKLVPGETAEVILDFDVDDTSPSENCDVRILKGIELAAGTEWETDEEASRYILDFSVDPAGRCVTIAGGSVMTSFKFRARVRDTDDTAGTDDADSTLTIHYVTSGLRK